MFFSVALSPGALNSSASLQRIRSLKYLFRAVAENGRLVTSDWPSLRVKLINLAMGQSYRAGALRGLVEEIVKNTKSFVSCVDCPADADEFRKLRHVAPFIDLLVVSDAVEAAQALALGIERPRVVLADEFEDSAIDTTRRRWLSAQRIDNISENDSAELLGRAVRFSGEILVADKMIGVSAKDGRLTREILDAADGLLVLCRAWRKMSPLANDHRLAVRVVTVAGDTASRAGVVKSTDVQAAIAAAAARNGLGGLCALQVELVQDRPRAIFNDRFLKAQGRVMGIQHGVSDLGRLLRPDARRHTLIDPPSAARDGILREILALPRVT